MNRLGGYISVLVAISGMGVVACRDMAKPENFYRIEGGFFHQIEKTEVEYYLSNTDKTGCIFMIKSEDEKIPVSDNPKRMPVIFITRLPEPDGEEFDKAFSNSYEKPPEGGSQ
jgi:hypothetical protein